MIQPFQLATIPMPNQLSEELKRVIKTEVSSILDKTMQGEDAELKEKFKEYVKSMIKEEVPTALLEDEDCEHEGVFENLLMKIYDMQKEINSGDEVCYELEQKFFKEHEDLTDDEKRVFSQLLRSDGPLAISHMLGLTCEEYIDNIKSLNEKV